MRLFGPASPRIVLGTHGFLNLRKLVLSQRDISTHKHVIGLTGQGKSKTLASLFVQLVEQGIGASLLDPHSDLADDVIGMLSDRGFFAGEGGERFFYVDFGRTDRYLPFNILKQPYDDNSVAKNIVETYMRAWPQLAEGAAPHFENMLLASSTVLIENRLPITAMPRLLTDRSYRDMLLEQVTDPEVVYYYKYRFDHWGRETADKVESTLNKVFNLTFSKALRYTLGQPDNALDFRRIIDEGISVVYDLGGLTDQDTQTFLGCLLTVGYEVAALSRGRTLAAHRREHHLILDEFSRFTRKSEKALTTMLSQTRKFGLFSTMTHQNFSPQDESLRRSLGNAMRIAFKVNREDALWLAPQFAQFDPHAVKHIVEEEHAQERTHPVFTGAQETYETMAVELSRKLAKRHAYVKLGEHVTKIRTLTLPEIQTSRVDLQRIKDHYAETLMTKREQVVEALEQKPNEKLPPKGSILV